MNIEIDREAMGSIRSAKFEEGVIGPMRMGVLFKVLLKNWLQHDQICYL